MHTIEFSNGNDAVRVVIASADREHILFKVGESDMMTSVTAYLDFAEAFIDAFHSLQGTAILCDRVGNEVIDVTFSHRGVRIGFHHPFAEKTLQTDQSYMTETMRQIGIWNRL
ncbi:hypothetical protein [Exiguobacterium qingdaonense]|uniref:hypothetical protein n=1 Tax=Exiguobacterium qingdaonense TaxID=2751251 RepID=UPI001BEACC80|nr:hypothetical protein [Exiguobacterium qingdaonense]